MSDTGTEESKETKKEEDLKLVIQRRIEELTKEIQSLVGKKQAYQRATKEVDTRLTQLMGAIEELSKLVPRDGISTTSE